MYDAEGRDREVELNTDVLTSVGPQQLLWIDVDEDGSPHLEEIARLLELDPDSLCSLADFDVARVENYGAYTQFAVVTAPATIVDNESDRQAAAGQELGSTVLHFIVAPQWLMTVHPSELTFIEQFRSERRAETTIGALTTHDFAASLLDAHLEAYFHEIARIEAMVDKLDEQALTNPSGKSLLGRLVTLRRRVSRLRSSLARQRGVFYGLSRPDLQIVAESGASPHFQVLTGRFERAIDEVEHTRDLVVGSFELFASRAAQQTNDLVRVLTYLTAVIGICAAVAGVFGMNFETSFFGVGDRGFYGTIVALTATIIASTALARWRGWI